VLDGYPYTPNRRVVVELRGLLTTDRAAGLPFSEAWARDVGRVLRLVTPGQAVEWRLALQATAGAWEAAYMNEPVQAIEKLAALVDQA
jgi:hypothetical protein